MNAQFRIAARSVGYRMGKTPRDHRPNFAELFTSEYVPDAEAGFDKGYAVLWRKEDERAANTTAIRRV